MTQLKGKRERVIDLFVEGIISADDRDQKLATIEKDLGLCIEQLGRIAPNPAFGVQELASLFEPFFEFQYLSRDQKRTMLGAVVPEIRIRNGQVIGFTLLPGVGVGSEISRRDKDSSPPPA
jgi:hypothetical protein